MPYEPLIPPSRTFRSLGPREREILREKVARWQTRVLMRFCSENRKRLSLFNQLLKS